MKVLIGSLLLAFAVVPAASQQPVAPSPKPTPVDNSAWITPMKAANEKAKNRDYAGAVESFTECLMARAVFACYYGRATAYLALKKYDLAMNDANDGLKVSPESSDLYSLRATLHRVNKKPLDAISDLDKAIEYDDENPEYYIDRADVYCSMKMKNVSFKTLALKDQAKAKELGGKVLKPCK
jgi:tetratricopeptide (TPR) repeat protein